MSSELKVAKVNPIARHCIAGIAYSPGETTVGDSGMALTPENATAWFRRYVEVTLIEDSVNPWPERWVMSENRWCSRCEFGDHDRCQLGDCGCDCREARILREALNKVFSLPLTPERRRKLWEALGLGAPPA